MTSTAVIKRGKSPPADCELRARDLMTGSPKEVKVRYREIAYCLDKSMAKIEEAIMKVLEQAPPKLSANIFTNGIHLTGGGALLHGLGQRLGARTKLSIHVSDDPLRALVKGTGAVLQDLDCYRSCSLAKPKH